MQRVRHRMSRCNGVTQILQRPQHISTNLLKTSEKIQESLLSPSLLASCSQHIGSEAKILTWPRPKKDVEHREVGTQNNMGWQQYRFPGIAGWKIPQYAKSCLWTSFVSVLWLPFTASFPSFRNAVAWHGEMNADRTIEQRYECVPSKCVALGVDADSPLSHLLSRGVCRKRWARIKCPLVAA